MRGRGDREGCTIEPVLPRAPLLPIAPPLLFALLWCGTGCFYLGPRDPCEDEPLPPTEFEFHACSPAKGSAIVLTEPWADTTIRCDITGATEIRWVVLDESSIERLQARDTTTLVLTEAMLPWVPDDDETVVRVEATNGVEAESTFWTLRMVEQVP